jgi:hypothetical protein
MGGFDLIGNLGVVNDTIHIGTDFGRYRQTIGIKSHHNGCEIGVNGPEVTAQEGTV